MTTASSQRLEEAIAASKATLDRWAAQQKSIADRMTSEAAVRLAEFEKRMEASHERLLALQLQRGLRLNNEKEGGNNPAIEKVQSAIQVRLSNNEKLEAVLAEKKSAIDFLVEERAKREAAAKQQLEEKTVSEIGNKATLDDLTRGLMCYKKLGIAFEKPSENSLSLHFSQIDPNEPEKRFTIEVGLNGRNEWIVTSCPLLPIELHDALVVPLNEKNDIGRFARTVRKAFVTQVQQ